VAEKAGEVVVEGAKKFGSMIANIGSWIGKKIYTSDFTDLDASQYRLTKGKIEKIIRKEDKDGKPIYFAVGVVESYKNKRPVITEYKEPINLGDWYPKVTHINGMMVKPEGGLTSAEALYLVINSKLEESGEAALATDVLYTYSAHRGLVTDAIECIKGKLYIEDDATRAQEQIILDSVRTKKRTTVSAHSRGTIKTDNAVRNAYAVLKREFLQKALKDPAIRAKAIGAADKYLRSLESGLKMDASALDTSMLIDIYINEYAKQASGPKAAAEMEKYIKLIYAGNAVQFPSSILKGHLFVASKDMVSGFFGKYFKFATKWFGSKMKMTEVKGGHGFDENYCKDVGDTIVKDLIEQSKQEGN